IGPPPGRASYLNIPNIVEAALKCGADAVHPGYGFLSEDADFAEVCADNGLTFVGPPVDVMRRAGDKTAMRRCMAAAGVPVLPGSDDALTTVAEAEEVAAEIGYPVVVKAVAGGGGRGIAVANTRSELQVVFRDTIAQ